MDTNRLIEVGARLRESGGLRRAALECFQFLTRDKAYGEWAGGAAQRRPFVLPLREAALLAQCGLAAKNGELAVRANLHRGRLFLTDGVWVDPNHRVFPFCDESEELLALAEHLGWTRRATCVVDLAGGCGHTAWSLDQPRQVLFDVNPRALAYAELNKILNGLDADRYEAIANNIHGGIPRAVADRLEGDVLLLANMPFGPAPAAGMLPQTSDGGEAGMRLQRATFAALRELAVHTRGRARMRALVMGLSLGDSASNRWMLHDEAGAQFGEERVSWHTCASPLLRIDGRRAMANPSPAGIALPAIADCTLYHNGPDRRAAVRKLWEATAQKHAAGGHPDLAYGIVALELA